MLQLGKNQFTLQIRVIPKSSRTGWGKVLENGDIQLRLTAPPVDGEANKMCIAFLAKEFKTTKSSVSILKGEKSRSKTLQVENYQPEKLDSFLAAHPEIA